MEPQECRQVAVATQGTTAPDSGIQLRMTTRKRGHAEPAQDPGGPRLAFLKKGETNEQDSALRPTNPPSRVL